MVNGNFFLKSNENGNKNNSSEAKDGKFCLKANSPYNQSEAAGRGGFSTGYPLVRSILKYHTQI